MSEKRLAQTLDEVLPAQMPEVLRLASELYAQDRAALERAEQQRELVNAAEEAGLPPEYLERAAATIQSRQSEQECGRRRQRPGPMLFVAIAVAGFLLARGASQIAQPPPPPAIAMPAAASVARPIGPCFEVSLAPYVTHRLDESMLSSSGNDLRHLLTGLDADGTPYRTFNGVRFRLDGIILFGPGETTDGPSRRVIVRPEVDGIRIGQKADRLHFLHGTHWQAQQGQTIATYVVRYEDGSSVRIPIRYGIDVVDWWAKADRSDEAARPHLVWVGSNDAANSPIRLFMKSWKNPRPEAPVRSVDLVTGTQTPGEGAAAPFLVGLTVEEATPASARAPRPQEP